MKELEIHTFDYSEESWLPVVGYETLYEVSSHGRVKALRREKVVTHRNGTIFTKYEKEKIKKQSNQSEGYLEVTLTQSHAKGKRYKVHRLVARAHIHNPDPENKTCVNHIDHNRKNNRIENLEWCTQTENNRHSPKNMKVICVETGNVYKSLTIAGIACNRSSSTISMSCNGKIKKGKLNFKYYKDYINENTGNL